MPTTLNAGSGGEVVETVNRNGSTDERQVVEFGYVPTYFALTGALTATASRFQFVLYNNNATAIAQVRKVVLLYCSATAVGGAFSGPWTQRIRTGLTTAPTGTGGVTVFSFDSGDTLPSSITAFSPPGTSPAGGTSKDLSVFLPQPDEVVITTLNAPTMASVSEYCGLTIYDFSSLGPNAKPITLRQNQSYEIQQDATAGLIAAYRLLCIFSAF